MTSHRKFRPKPKRDLPKNALLALLEKRYTEVSGFKKRTMEAFADTAKDVATFKERGYRMRVKPDSNEFVPLYYIKDGEAVICR